MEQTILGAIAQALQISVDDLTASITVDGTLLAGDALKEALVPIITENVTIAKNDQHKRGVRVTDEAYQRYMKSQGFEIPKDDKQQPLKGTAALQAFVEWQKEQLTPADPGKKPEEMTEQELEKLPAFKAIVARRMTVLQGEVESAKKELSDFKNGVEAKTVVESAKGYIAKFLEDNGAVLEVETLGIKKADRLEKFYKLVDFGKVRFDEATKKPYLVDEGGERAVNADTGREILFDDYIKEINVGMYGFQKQDPSKKSPSPGKQPAGGKQGGEEEVNFASEADARNATMSADPKTRLQGLTWLASNQES